MNQSILLGYMGPIVIYSVLDYHKQRLGSGINIFFVNWKHKEMVDSLLDFSAFV